jgi:hypothetical protein
MIVEKHFSKKINNKTNRYQNISQFLIHAINEFILLLLIKLNYFNYSIRNSLQFELPSSLSKVLLSLIPFSFENLLFIQYLSAYGLRLLHNKYKNRLKSVDLYLLYIEIKGLTTCTDLDLFERLPKLM